MSEEKPTDSTPPNFDAARITQEVIRERAILAGYHGSPAPAQPPQISAVGGHVPTESELKIAEAAERAERAIRNGGHEFARPVSSGGEERPHLTSWAERQRESGQSPDGGIGSPGA